MEEELPTMNDDQDSSEEQPHLRDAYIINHAVRKGAILVNFHNAVQPSPPVLLRQLSCCVVDVLRVDLACVERIKTHILPVCGHMWQSKPSQQRQAPRLQKRAI